MFEGSEKKIELVFSKKSPSLFKRPFDFWKKIVHKAGAEIISHIRFPQIHSFILSESSLLLWERRLVLITCGKTRLLKSLIKLLKSFPKENMAAVFFQRKNEFFPHSQDSCFFNDAREIVKSIPGKAFRFGPLSDRHFFLFHSDSEFFPSEADQTLEILIYESELFDEPFGQAVSKLKKALARAFYGFETHDHFFQPAGWSLNAARGQLYYTVHITPEKDCFYISFETNIKESSVQSLTAKVADLFRPLSFDFILFAPRGGDREMFASEEFFSGPPFYRVLDCGWNVSYKSFYKKDRLEQSPFEWNPKAQRFPFFKARARQSLPLRLFHKL